MSYEITAECVSCGACVEECLIHAIKNNDDQYQINPEYCCECANCTYVCDVDAIIKV